jgi:rRNA maturation RNase YbeY
MKINLLGDLTQYQQRLFSRWAKKVLSAIKGRIPRNAKALNIIIVPDSFIQKLNKNFLGRDYPTDVLAFPLMTRLSAKIIHRHQEEILWGEIYISKDRAKKQAKELEITANEEICNLITHGILHLAQYNHREMKKIEDKLKTFY